MVRVAEQAKKVETYPTHQRVGEIAVWGAGVFAKELGVNDPVTHQEQYLMYGEDAIASIDEDLTTDCAERLVKPRFINPVRFKRSGNDFISKENQFSMRDMTTTTENIFSSNVTDIRLYKRSKVERQEVDRLNEWFAAAEAGEAFIVESLPLTKNERYTIVRIYEKINNQELEEHIVTLHNSTVDIFNELHQKLEVDVPKSRDELELLGNMYVIKPGKDKFEDFLEDYINNYDATLESKNPGQEFAFGLSKKERPKDQDDLKMVREQVTLKSIYLDTIRLVAKSGGRVTPELINLNKDLCFGMNLSEGQKMTVGIVRNLLDNSLQYIMATLNEASEQTLKALAASTDKSYVYETAGGYGSAAAEAGVRYEGACPSGSGGVAAQEAAALAHSNRTSGKKEKMNCPFCGATQYGDPCSPNQDCGACEAQVRGGRVTSRGRGRQGNAKEYISGFDILAADSVRIGIKLFLKDYLEKLEEQLELAPDEFTKRRLVKEIAELNKLRLSGDFRHISNYRAA